MHKTLSPISLDPFQCIKPPSDEFGLLPIAKTLFRSTKTFLRCNSPFFDQVNRPPISFGSPPTQYRRSEVAVAVLAPFIYVPHWNSSDAIFANRISQNIYARVMSRIHFLRCNIAIASEAISLSQTLSIASPPLSLFSALSLIYVLSQNIDLLQFIAFTMLYRFITIRYCLCIKAPVPFPSADTI